jgi:hypothetical protein
MLLVVVLSATAGAIGIVTGFMLFTGALDSATFTEGTFTERVDDAWWWYVAALVLALAGGISQARDISSLRRSVRMTWSEARV